MSVHAPLGRDGGVEITFLDSLDGRFIEKIGYYNPILPRDHADRLKLDLDKAKAWIAKGAIASDRVHRFLSDAGLVKPLSKQNPDKAKPKKKAQERAAAAAAPQA